MSGLKIPLYMIFDIRPVKFIPTKDGGMDILAFNWNTGEFKKDLSYLSKLFRHSPDAYEVTEKEFFKHVNKLIEKINQRKIKRIRKG